MFTYRALAAGTKLRAEVRGRSGLLPAGWVSSLTGSYTLGVSRKDDYGRVNVTATAGAAPSPPRLGRVGGGTRLVVWLVSDMVLTDSRLRPSTQPLVLQRVLERALGLRDDDLEPVVVERDGETGGERVATVLATRRTESWQARWGLPRATLCGFAAGSVATFELATGAVLDNTAVAKLHVEGLGERRGEGFGQVLVAVEGGPPNLLTSFSTWRRDGATGQAVVLGETVTATDTERMGGHGGDYDEVDSLEPVDVGYLLWGEPAPEPDQRAGWRTLSSARIGVIRVPGAWSDPRPRRLSLHAREYLAVEETFGNTYVFEERLVAVVDGEVHCG